MHVEIDGKPVWQNGWKFDEGVVFAQAKTIEDAIEQGRARIASRVLAK